MPLSTATATILADYLFDTLEPAAYVALWNGSPGVDGAGGAELSGNGYARAAVGGWDAASGGSRANSVVVSFPLATGPWGDATHFAIFDAASGGNLIAFGSIAVPFSPANGQTWTLPVGELVLAVS